MKVKARVIARGLAVCLLTQTAVAGPLEDAQTAFNRQDYASAFKLMQPLAEQGVPAAQTALGWMYARAEGTNLDFREAMKWYQRAADQGYAEAQYLLGKVYENKEGVPYNGPEAVKWYKLAADQGFTEAQTRMCDLYATGWIVGLNPSEAWRLCLLAGNKGDMFAQYKLGMMYAKARPYHQMIWFQDPVQSYYWFTLADPSNSNTIEGPAWFRQILAQHMTPNQIAEAKRLATEWLTMHPKQ
jgi:TPR repeat protein